MSKSAVMLSGCGVMDGSEVREAVSLLINLSRAGADVRIFAPDKPQSQVIDHTTNEPVDGETRNVMTESARIARGEIEPIEKLRADDFDCVLFPGGYGAASNLCDFASKGADMSVDPEVERVVKEFNAAEKPIGMCCIAPVIAAKVLDGPRLTLGGAGSDAAKAAEKMGASHVEEPVNEIVVCEKTRLVTAPAYMYGDAPLHEIDAGIGKMVVKTLELAGAPSLVS